LEEIVVAFSQSLYVMSVSGFWGFRGQK